MELKTLDFNESHFTANNKEYVIETELSIQRGVKLEEAFLMLETGMRPGKQMEEWKKVFDLISVNQNKGIPIGEIAVIAHNNVNAIKRMYEQHHPYLVICALYINRVDEDRRWITDDLINDKIKDWELEGYSKGSFFSFALSSWIKEVKSSADSTLNILEIVQDFNERLKKGEFNTPISQ